MIKRVTQTKLDDNDTNPDQLLDSELGSREWHGHRTPPMLIPIMGDMVYYMNQAPHDYEAAHINDVEDPGNPDSRVSLHILAKNGDPHPAGWCAIKHVLYATHGTGNGCWFWPVRPVHIP